MAQSKDHHNTTHEPWLLADFECQWTIQSDYDSRAISDFTQAVAVSVALLGLIGIWVLGDAKEITGARAAITAFLLALPNAISLMAFQHNVSIRRAAVLAAAYWAAVTAQQQLPQTGLIRYNAYEAVLRDDARYKSLRGDANDPILRGYWAVFLVSLALFLATVPLTPPAGREAFIAWGALFFFVPFLLLLQISTQLKRKNYDLMFAACSELLSREAQHQETRYDAGSAREA